MGGFGGGDGEFWGVFPPHFWDPGVHRAAPAPASAGLFIPHRREKKPQNLQPPPKKNPSNLRVCCGAWGAPDTPKNVLGNWGESLLHPPNPSQVPGDHPHPPDGPPRIQVPVGAAGGQGDLQEGRAALCGQGEAVLGG